MSNHKTYDIKPEIVATAHLDEAGYHKMYAFSIKEPDKFWDEQAKQFLDWMEPWEKVREFNYATASIRWFEGAKLNVSQNCLDRHLATRGDQAAIIWEGDDRCCGVLPAERSRVLRGRVRRMPPMLRRVSGSSSPHAIGAVTGGRSDPPPALDCV
jgi:hypothetical protein